MDIPSQDDDINNKEGLQVLLQREDQHATIDYLGINEERRRQARDQNDAPSLLAATTGRSVRAHAQQSSSAAMIEGLKEWESYLAKRETIVKWGYDVTDYYLIPREAVAMAMNYVDRMVIVLRDVHEESHHAIFENYHFLALSCLFLACKLVHKTPHNTFINIAQMSRLSKGAFTPQDIMSMESKILSDLHWFVHPPTAVQFLMYYMEALQLDDSIFAEQLHDQSFFLVEQAVLDYFFIDQKPSTIALAALSNIMQSLLPKERFADPAKSLQAAVGLTLDSHCVRACRERFYEIMDSIDLPPPAPAGSPEQDGTMGQRINSPVNVIHRC